MKIIQQLSDMISEEIDDAEKYIRCALKHKDTDRGLADVFNALSLDEMRHSQVLHTEVVKQIEKIRKERGDPPKEMLAVYDYLHEKQIDHAAEVKAMQTMYKET